MIQLKFKAWHKQKNELLFGTAGKDGGLVFVKPLDIYSDEREEVPYRDKDLEIMQYTGLKDATGKEIYEGDIVIDSSIAENSPKFEVWYNAETASFEPLNKLNLSNVKIIDSKFKIKI